MGKKKDKKNKGGTGSEYFDYAYGVGEAKSMMKRYGVEGASMGNPRMGGTQRSVDDVKEDLAKAMMNDYDTRRTMEAAAMAGNKDAKKYAKKGFKSGNIQDAYGVMRDLKKEYVGGGGMDGSKNRAGLTYAMVKEDRKVHNEDIDARIAANTPELPEEDPDKGFTDPVMSEESDKLKEAKERAGRWNNSESGSTPVPYDADDEQDGAANTPATTETSSDATSMLGAFKEKLKNERNFRRDY